MSIAAVETKSNPFIKGQVSQHPTGVLGLPKLASALLSCSCPALSREPGNEGLWGTGFFQSFRRAILAHWPGSDAFW